MANYLHKLLLGAAIAALMGGCCGRGNHDAHGTRDEHAERSIEKPLRRLR